MLRFASIFFLFYTCLFGVESIADSIAKDLAKSGDFNSFFMQCKKRDFESCYLLGKAYLSGYQVLPNEKEAKKYLNLACQNNVLESCLLLSQDAGNTHEKLDIFNKSCEANNLESCSKLAHILESNISIDSSNDEKQMLLKTLNQICKLNADSKCDKAREFRQNYLSNNADLYFSESLNECEEAIKYNENVAKPNIARLQVCGALGDRYANGKGVTLDKQKAQYYYHYACQANKVYCYKEILDSILNP